jgi:Tol biopolymer transport system component
MAANGSERTRLTRALQDEESSITWSPSGSDIALLRTANARDPGHARIDVWMMRADGSGQTRVTDKANFGSLCWSADGQVLAYVSRGQISLTRLATGKSRRIYTPGQLDAFSWSPDGKTFAVILTRAGRTDLHTVSADGTGNLRRLTNDRIAETNPQWSPDGKLIGFARRSD